MSKQDRQGVRTPSDVERKYNLGEIMQRVSELEKVLGGAEEDREHPGCHYRTVNGQREWWNPPMQRGEEYRTTERFNGKVVYAKLVDFGSLPNSTSKTAAYCSTGATAAVSVKAVLSDGCVLGEGYGKDLSYSSAYGVYIDNTLYNVRMTAEADFSGLSAEVLVKYTKD